MCQLLFEAELKPHQIHRYGRAGQSQYGVDIAVSAQYREWMGIQCKLRNEMLGGALTETDIINEHEKSKRFHSPLTKLLIVTTCIRDRKILDIAATISGSFQRKHPVEVLFWDDIERYLDNHPSIANRFYPEFFPPESSLNETRDGDLNITLQRTDWQQRLELFFRHDSFRSMAGAQLESLMLIASELIDNAFHPNKGCATRGAIKLTGNVLSVRDNGVPFDSVSYSGELAPEMRGLRAIRKAFATANTDLEHRYKPADRAATLYNLNEITVCSNNVLRYDLCSVSGPLTYLLNRSAAVEFVRNLTIPPQCQSFTLRLLGDIYFNHSAGSELVSMLLQRLNGRQLRIKIGMECVELINALGYPVDSSPYVVIEQV